MKARHEVWTFVWQAMLSRVALWAIAFCLLIVSPLTPTAIALTSNTANEQIATLTSPKVNTPIPIYLRPAANQPNVGYGNNGDTVSVLEEFGDFLMEGDKAATWSHIRLEDSPYTESWVRGTSLTLSSDKEWPLP